LFSRLLIALLVASTMLVSGGQAAAAGVTHWVNKTGSTFLPPGTSCASPGYANIQDAVNAATAGDIINVCPGTYPEQVHVDGTVKNGIVLRSVVPLAAVIKAPLTIAVDLVNFQAIVRINAAQNVTLAAFTVSGPGPGGCGSIGYGVRVDNGGSALIRDNHIVDIRDQPLSGCQNGTGIRVGRMFEATTGRAAILNNLIERYQKNGITIDNAGSSAAIRGNDIRGIGANPIIAQNGIQVSRGATGDVRGNAVVDNAYIVPLNLPEFTATGILLFRTGAGTIVEGNGLNRNQDGIGIYTTTNNRIGENTVIGGIPPFAPGLGSLTLGDGIFADTDTANNLIIDNFLRDNRKFDCEDVSAGPNNPPALVANPWVNDDGVTQNRPGLCRPKRDGEDDRGDRDHERDHHFESEDD
jgi:parallel beta-helix repeat protein